MDGRCVKDHLDRFCKLLRQHHIMPVSVLWILEFQSRGAPHFHLFMPAFIPFKAIAWLWCWATCCIADLQAGTSICKVPNARYALKYSQKLSQKVVPLGYENVGRFWGIWGVRTMKPLVVATTLDVDREMAGCEVEMERFMAEKDHYRIYDFDFGFLAFPG